MARSDVLVSTEWAEQNLNADKTVFVEVDEDTCKYFVDWFGDDNIVFSTDYPHADCKYPQSLDFFFELPLSESTQRKVLWDNFCRLYDFPLDYTP